VFVEKCPQSPAAPVNGSKEVLRDDAGFEDKVIFNCNKGFGLNGRSLAKCEEGKWSSPSPTCVKF